MPYSLDLRKKIIYAIKNSLSQTEAATVFNITRRTIYSWLSMEEKTGSLEAKTGFQKGHSHGITDLDKFRKFVDEHADYTQEEMAEHFAVGSSTIGRTLKKIGYTRKKRITRTQSVRRKRDMSLKKR